MVLFGRPKYGETFAIHNPKRFGKTLTAVFIIIRRLRTEPDIAGVVSNIWLNLKSIGMQHKYHFLEDIETIKKLKGKYILFIDEIRRYVDSRMSISLKNRFISNLLADLGKQRVDFYYTDQDALAADKRIRLNVDYVLAPFYAPHSKWCSVYIFDSIQRMIDFLEFGMGRPLWRYAFYAPPYFKYFDTEQKIEDYMARFKVEEYVNQYLRWKSKNGYEDAKTDYQMLNLWCATEGISLSATEKSAMLKFMRLHDLT